MVGVCSSVCNSMCVCLTPGLGMAAAVQEQALNAGKKVALVVSGGNVDSSVFAGVLRGQS